MAVNSGDLKYMATLAIILYSFYKQQEIGTR